MKKILSILMILALVGGVAFAQVEPAFKGEATLSWGIDLGKGTTGDDAKISHGFLNEASASVSLPFVKSGASKGEGDVYAYIDLSKVNLGLSADMNGAKATGKVGAVSAKIVFYGAYLTIYNVPSMQTQYSNLSFVGDEFGVFRTGLKDGYGTKIGYANKDLMDLNVGVKFVSNGSWKDRDGDVDATYIKDIITDGTRVIYVPAGQELRYYDVATSSTKIIKGPYYNYLPAGKYELWKSKKSNKDLNSKYGFGIDFHMVPVEKFLTIDAGFNMSFNIGKEYQNIRSTWKDSRAIGFGVKLASNPVEGLNFTLGFDGGTDYRYENKKLTDVDKTDGSPFAWALGFSTDYTHKQVGTVDFGMFIASDSTPYGKGSVVDPSKDFGATWKKGAKGQIDIAMTLGYSGLPIVEDLDIHARVNVFRLLSKISDAKKNDGIKLPLGVNFGAAYTAKITDSISIKPYADLWAETNVNSYQDGTPAADQKNYIGLAYKVGLAFMPMERLTIDACWEQGEMDENFAGLGAGLITAPVQHKSHNGKFILSAKITF